MREHYEKAYKEYNDVKSNAAAKGNSATTARAVYLSDAKFKTDELLGIKHPPTEGQ